MSAQEIPASLYFIIGFLIFSNAGSILAFLVFIFKCGQFVARTEHGIADAKDTGVRAHKRIDKMEQKCT